MNICGTYGLTEDGAYQPGMSQIYEWTLFSPQARQGRIERVVVVLVIRPLLERRRRSNGSGRRQKRIRGKKRGKMRRGEGTNEGRDRHVDSYRITWLQAVTTAID